MFRALCFTVGVSVFAFGCSSGSSGGGTGTVANPAIGILDTTFDGDGLVSIDATGGQNDFGRATLVQPDGRILVVGGTTTSGALIARMNADGTPDTTFSTDGLETYDAPGGDGEAFNAVVLQPDGKILVAGEFDPGSAGSRNGLVARLNADGSLDRTFDGDGFAVADFGLGISVDNVANDLALQSDGSILVAGGVLSASLETPGVIRLASDGTLDTAYGANGNGKAVFDTFGVTGPALTGIALQSDGKAVVAGPDLAGDDFFVGRFDVDGMPDTTFDGDGSRTIDFFGSSSTEVSDILVQSDGMIVVGGTLVSGSDDFIVARLDSAGALDTGFAGSGTALAALGFVDKGHSMLIDQQGKLVMVGESNANGSLDFAFARWNSDGSVDTTVNPNGTFPGTDVYDFSGGDDQAFGCAIQPDGRIVSAGLTRDAAATDDAVGVTRLQ